MLCVCEYIMCVCGGGVRSHNLVQAGQHDLEGVHCFSEMEILGHGMGEKSFFN